MKLVTLKVGNGEIFLNPTAIVFVRPNTASPAMIDVGYAIGAKDQVVQVKMPIHEVVKLIDDALRG